MIPTSFSTKGSCADIRPFRKLSMCQKQGPVTIGNGPLLLTIIINIEQYTIKLDKSYLLTKSFVYELQAKI